MKAIHVLISGRVQGVWYRASTAEKAASLGIRGWVRNLTDDRVEAWFQGDAQALEKQVAWCHKGPPNSRVDGVAIETVEPNADFTQFEVLSGQFEVSDAVH